ncbi:MAG: squalene/phytoene synthase family protein [Acidobacteriota bacterium]
MADLDDLLRKTSRTFALSIPLLPEPTRRQVTLAYLLFRIADTFEDATAWGKAKRRRALHDFCALLEADPASPDAEHLRDLSGAWSAEAPIDHAGYRELVVETPAVIAAYRELEPAARLEIGAHTCRTARGMAEYVERTADGELELRDLQDLRDYCYVVAGIVGEMLTELFLLGRPQLAPAAEALRARSRRAGEAQQLVNILKDSAFDATEGRTYLPPDLDRAEVFALARKDLIAAGEYVLLLQEHGAERGVVAFNALPVLLAFAALDAVERRGPGAKISRARVFTIKAKMDRALDRGEPVVSLPEAGWA